MSLIRKHQQRRQTPRHCMMQVHQVKRVGHMVWLDLIAEPGRKRSLPLSYPAWWDRAMCASGFCRIVDGIRLDLQKIRPIPKCGA